MAVVYIDYFFISIRIHNGTADCIDWNVAESDNCDNCGRSYSTGLNHRSILYWQTGATNGTYEDNQWFHAQSLSLTDSTGPDNDFQDFEFYYKSK